MHNCRVKSALVSNQQGLFQIPNSVSCDFFSVANLLEARLVEFLARWLIAWNTLGANPVLMDVVEVWGASVPTFNDEILVGNRQY